MLTGHTHSTFTSAPRLAQHQIRPNATADMVNARCIAAFALVLFCAASASVSLHARRPFTCDETEPSCKHLTAPCIACIAPLPCDRVIQGAVCSAAEACPSQWAVAAAQCT